jgi:hypothetical protein
VKLRALAAVALLGATAPAGWLVTDRLERENDFCNACHVQPDVPLHAAIRRDFDAAPPASLAGVHGAAHVEGREDPAFRCIDCHGGASLPGRARVKVLAALDGFWYLTGRFEEPDHMAWPLWDEDCGKCHAASGFDTSVATEQRSQPFHSFPVHNVDLAVRCVECHAVHVPGGDAENQFLHADVVRGRCAVCHTEFEEDPT